jgi:hypothetical protein
MKEKVEKVDENCWHLFIDESGTSSYKRLIKLKEKNGWQQFQRDLDPQNANFFSLMGLLISCQDLVNSFIPAIRRIKSELYKDENIVLHFSDMLAAQGRFEMYKNNPGLFKDHLTYFTESIEDIDFRMFIVHIDKVQMLNTYQEPLAKPANPYEFAPTIIMERVSGYIMNRKSEFVKSNSDEISPKPIVRVWFESRNKKDDTELKNYMIDELKLPEDELFKKTHFPRYEHSTKNVRSLEWHIHGLPKDPMKLKEYEWYKSNYSFEVGSNLIHGIHVVDIMVSARRRFIENLVYPNPKIKYFEVEPITYFMSKSRKVRYEKTLPDKDLIKIINKLWEE